MYTCDIWLLLKNNSSFAVFILQAQFGGVS